MAPKRKAPGNTASHTRSSGKASATVVDLFSSLPLSRRKVTKTAKDLICEDSWGSEARKTDSWPKHYAPQSRGALAVHKKKLEEFDLWFTTALTGSPTTNPASLCCCVSGPPGSARSTTVSVLAKEHGCCLQYWSFPTPTLWAEHKHIGGQSQYASKMQEFETFVDHAKLAPLVWTDVTKLHNSGAGLGGNDEHNGGNSNPSSTQYGTRLSDSYRTVSVVSDFPHAQTPEDRAMFCDHLAALVQTAKHPVILLVTESARAGPRSEVFQGVHQQRSQSMEQLIIETVKASGGVHVAFNPITARSCVRELKRIATAEKLSVSGQELESLVAEVHCDMHNAIQSLQMLSMGCKGRHSKQQLNRRKSVKSAKSEMHSRDLGLSLFHALGKILHNKRFDKDGQQVKAAADIPESHVEPSIVGLLGQPSIPAEEVVSRSGLGASVVTSFLFENYPLFISDMGIVDAAAASANFSDAIYMLGQAASDTSTFGSQWVDTELSTTSPADAVASTIACRGYMWANQHPAASKWHPICAAKLNTVARAAISNRAELAERAVAGRQEMEPAVMCAVQVVPFARVMAASMPGHPASQWLPPVWKRWWNGAVVDDGGGGVQRQQLAPASAEPDAVDLEDPIEEM